MTSSRSVVNQKLLRNHRQFTGDVIRLDQQGQSGKLPQLDLQDERADLQKIAILKQTFFQNADSVEQGAIPASEIPKPNLCPSHTQQTMLSTDPLTAGSDVAFRTMTDHVHPVLKNDLFPLWLSVHHTQKNVPEHTNRLRAEWTSSMKFMGIREVINKSATGTQAKVLKFFPARSVCKQLDSRENLLSSTQRNVCHLVWIRLPGGVTEQVLIDSTHRRWALFTIVIGTSSVVLFLNLRQSSAQPWMKSPESVGYGVAGFLLILFAGLLSLHRRFPRWTWWGRRASWLRAHLWFGLLSGVLLLCHSEFRWGGTETISLWVIYLLVLITGMVGLVIQQILPRMITTRVSCEAPQKQVPLLCGALRHKADALMDQICGTFEVVGELEGLSSTNLRRVGNDRVRLRTIYETRLRNFFSPNLDRRFPLLNPVLSQTIFDRLRALPGLTDVQKEIDQVEALIGERRELWERERLRRWLTCWLFLHVPCSVLLILAGVGHAILALTR